MTDSSNEPIGADLAREGLRVVLERINWEPATETEPTIDNLEEAIRGEFDQTRIYSKTVSTDEFYRQAGRTVKSEPSTNDPSYRDVRLLIEPGTANYEEQAYTVIMVVRKKDKPNQEVRAKGGTYTVKHSEGQEVLEAAVMMEVDKIAQKIGNTFLPALFKNISYELNGEVSPRTGGTLRMTFQYERRTKEEFMTNAN